MKILKTILKVVLIVVGLLALVAGSVIYSQWMIWPLWSAIPIFFVFLLLLWLLVVIWKTARKAIRKAAAKSVLGVQGKSLKESLKEIQQKWKTANRTLNRSKLRKSGNPLYALPWFLTIGAPSSGKTAALAGALLASPIKSQLKPAEVGPTENCDWWFFDKAVFIDTAGRYAVSQEEGFAREEWRKLLSLLRRSRRKEPINGLIVTVSVDDLVNKDHDQLRDQGKEIRARIDEIMDLIQANFPVYILVTKIDLLYGMDKWQSRIDEETLNQSLGALAGSKFRDVDEFLKETLDTIVDRLKDLGLALMRGAKAKSVNTLQNQMGALLLPREISALKPALYAFCSGAFSDNPYQETPFVRGLFFSSSVNTGPESSSILERFGLTGGSVHSSGSFGSERKRGLFLRDFFDKTLPNDKTLVAPLKSSLARRKLAGRAWLVTWAVTGLALCAILSFSFTKTFKTVKGVINDFPLNEEFSGVLRKDLPLIINYKNIIEDIEDIDLGFSIMEYPFSQNVSRLERKAKSVYTERFRRSVMSEIDKNLSIQVSGSHSKLPDNIFGEFVEHVVRRINIIRARLAGATFEELMELPLPSPAALISLDPGVDMASAGKFDTFYVSYIAWRNDTEGLKKDLGVMREWINELALPKEGNLRWLVAWVDGRRDIKRITVEQFWQGSRTVPDLPSVQPAFTQKGKKAIYSFLEELENATSSQLAYERLKGRFDDWYFTMRLNSWENFILNFADGSKTLYDKEEWKRMVTRITTIDGPYNSMLNTLYSEFEAAEDDLSNPVWLRLAFEFRSLQALEGDDSNIMKKTSFFGRLFSSKLKTAMDKGSSVSGASTMDSVNAQINAAELFKNYQEQIAKVWKDSAAGAGHAYKTTSEFFQYAVDPGVKDAAINQANDNLIQIKNDFIGANEHGKAFWKILRGPFGFILKYANEETACYLQTKWESDVLASVYGIPADDLRAKLFGEGGKVWAYTGETAKPFIWQDYKNYYPFSAWGHTIGFKQEFFQFLNDGVRQKARLEAEAKQSAPSPDAPAVNPVDTLKQDIAAKTYNVTLSGIPTDVNEDAKARPFVTTLTVDCAEKPLTVENYNFPVSDNFPWKYGACSDTTLTIKFEKFSVSKTWKGDRGFLDFIREFRDGTVRYGAEHFPSKSEELANAGLLYMEPSFSVTGQDKLLADFKKLDDLEQKANEERNFENQKKNAELASIRTMWEKVAVPKTITSCWNPPESKVKNSSEAMMRSQNATTGQEKNAAPHDVKDTTPGKIDTVSPDKPVVSASGSHYIKIGMFRKKEFAQSAIKALGLDDKEAVVDEATLKEKIYYRLRIGPYATAEEAQTAFDHLKASIMATQN